MTEPSQPTPVPSRPPSRVPIFPLTGSLLLPGNFLPLNVFEPRYRNMVADALDGARYIGMIQPVVPRQDNRPDPLAPPDDPDLYAVGCVGLIEQAEKQEDGRYLVLLKGVSRFRIEEELPAERGYRRVVASYEDFADDLAEPSTEVDPGPLLSALSTFGDQHGLEFEMERLQLMPGVLLLNGLSAALPFHPAEKQALLEAPTPIARREMLLQLMGFGLSELGDDHDYSPPTVN